MLGVNGQAVTDTTKVTVSDRQRPPDTTAADTFSWGREGGSEGERKSGTATAKKRTTRGASVVAVARTSETSEEIDAIALSRRYWPAFREWVLSLVEKHKSVSRSAVIAAAKEAVGASSQTAQRYIANLTNDLNGPLQLRKVGDAIMIEKRGEKA